MQTDSESNKLTTLIDIMLMSLVSARGKQPDDAEVIVDDLWKDLMADWGRFLESYIKRYKLEHPDEE